MSYWQGSTGVATTVSPEDCTPYATSNLQAVDLGSSGWAVTDGTRQLVLLDNQSDANGALSILKQYSSQCFIGRGNTRSNPLDFTIPYYK
jgi:type 1 fimbria pilin